MKIIEAPKDYILITKEAVRFETAEKLDCSGYLKQHGFVEVDRPTPYTGDYYKSNMSICGRIGISDGDKYVGIEEVGDEPLNMKSVCKNCLKIYNTYPSSTNKT